MDSKIFKSYDIRGRYPEEINEKAVFEIAAKLPRILKKRIVVGRDARLSSPRLYQAILKGLAKKSGIKIIAVGVATTPMFYFLVNKLKAGGGVMVTASHNPKDFNGLKIVGKYARLISSQSIYELFQ